MSASDYNKQDAVDFGRRLGDLVDAVRGDGVDIGDFKQLIGAVSAAGAAINEMKDVPEAAAEHISGGIGDCLGDHALERALAAEAAPSTG
jgi:hypothetical protein